MTTARRRLWLCGTLFFATLSGLTICPKPLQAQTRGPMTFHNRTPYDIWVAVGIYRRAGNNSVLGIDPSSGSAGSQWPHLVETKGWYKINRYGGSITVPQVTHVFITGSDGRKLTGFLDGSKSFPIKRGVPFEFKKTFDFDEKNDPWAKGTLRQATEQQGMLFQMFAPVARFPQGELTLDVLGWQ